MRAPALALAALTAVAAAADAQQDDGPARPKLLAAMGLLDGEEVTVRHARAPDFTLVLPSSDAVTAERLDVPEDENDIVASWEFRTGEGAVVETLTVTVARIDPADPLVRQFAMANLLVLRSYAEIARRFPGARLIAFGPVQREDALSAVQAIGNFQTEDGRTLVFRHVGLMADGREQALVAIVNIDPERMPVRSDAELVDTFAGHAIASLRLIGESATAGE